MTALQHLRPSVLRALAAILEAREPPNRRCSSDLTDEGVAKLGEILSSGGTPALGLWRRYRKSDDA